MWSISNNIAYGSDEKINEKVVKAAKLAESHNFIEQLENGYENIIGERGATLSGGEKQRIAIARMIMNDPEIIMLDEATSSLDSKSEMLIKKSIDRISKEKTVIAVAHRLSTVIDFDKIIVLKNGRIVEQGNPRDLLMKKDLFYQMVKNQQLGENIPDIAI